MAKPYLINQDTINKFLSAGINPKTGLPTRIATECYLKDEIKKQLRVIDEQQAINRYQWYNLPSELPANLIERVLYYRGQGAFFFLQDRFYFLPYALAGSIDVYGQFTEITPVPFCGGSTKKDEAWIPGLVFKPMYNIGDALQSNIEHSCVLLSDYSKQYSQTVIARQQLQEPLLETMAECLPLLRTNLLAHSGVTGMRVGSEDEQSNVAAANNSIVHAAQTGKYMVPIVGNLDFQSLTNSGTGTAQEYLMAFQAFDNFRLQTYGLKNGGIYDKNSYVNTTTAGAIQANVDLQYQDGLKLRQSFCDLVNITFGLNIWCDSSEIASLQDNNMDGQIQDNQEPNNMQEMQEVQSNDQNI